MSEFLVSRTIEWFSITKGSKYPFFGLFSPIECVRTVQLKLTEVDLKLHKDFDPLRVIKTAEILNEKSMKSIPA